MAAKPILSNITSFDINKMVSGNYKTVSFTFSNAPKRWYYNTLTIYEADLKTIVYKVRYAGGTGRNIIQKDLTGTSSDTYYVIKSCAMTNNKQYYATITCYDDLLAEVGMESEYVSFFCYSTPSFTFNNVTDGQNVVTSTLEAKVKYSDPSNNQYVQNYHFSLYDKDHKLKYDSGTLYTSEIKYTFTDLETKTDYYIRCQGVTTKNIEVDTGYLLIHVKYDSPSTYSRMYTTVNNRTGVVQYQSNFKIIEPNVDQSQYEVSDSCVWLLNKTLTYDQEFIIQGDFTIGIKVKKPSGTILECKNADEGFKLDVINGDDSTFRFKLTVPYGVMNYILYSEPYMNDDTEWYVIYIRRKNNVYGLYDSVEYMDVTQSNWWFDDVDDVPMGTDIETNDILIQRAGQELVHIKKDDLEFAYKTEAPTGTNAYAIWLGDGEL